MKTEKRKSERDQAKPIMVRLTPESRKLLTSLARAVGITSEHYATKLVQRHLFSIMQSAPAHGRLS
jgi:hypothetical protein